MKTRAPNTTAAMRDRGEFWVKTCTRCQHPGGLHIAWPAEKIGCRCTCDCPGYVDGDYGRWSHNLTHALVPGWFSR